MSQDSGPEHAKVDFKRSQDSYQAQRGRFRLLDVVDAATATVQAKGAPSRLDDVRLETLDEGRCVQALHVGSFDDEAPLLAQLHDELLPRQGLVPTGRHHEIYLSDARKVEPAKRRTILRQPVGDAPGA